MSQLINLALFQGTWLAAVLGASAGRNWTGPAALAATLAAQSLPGVPARLPGPGLLGSAAIAGFAVDWALALGGVMEPSGASSTGRPPLWLAALWVNFAATLDEGLRWAGRRWVLAGACGAVGGPLAYLAAERAGALTLAPGWGATACIGLLWAVAFPGLAVVARRGRQQGGTPTGEEGAA